MCASLQQLVQRYGARGLLRLVLDVIYTKICISRYARVFRRPAYIRGAKFICFGKGLTVGVAVRLDASNNCSGNGVSLSFGENVQLNDYVHIGAIDSVSIGNNVLIASKVFISDHGHGAYGSSNQHDSPDIPPALRQLEIKPVVIEDNVWIGELASVLPGVTIGYGSVIGAGSVVTKDIPPRCIAVGNPAKVIKRYDEVVKTWVRL
jgi:lipopolysaccharide O-acetyltransferase